MLTSIYYYGHYRDFVQRGVGKDNGRIWLKHDESRLLPKNSVVQLNKALNARVVDYAKTLSTSIIGLKDAAKMFLYDAHAMTRNGPDTFESHIRWIEEDLNNFIDSYNGLQNIAVTTNHSASLPIFAHNIRNFAVDNRDILSHLGVIAAYEDGLSYHGFGAATSHEIVREAATVFRDAYEVAVSFLDRPLTHHMEFKGLNYYYNYTIGSIEENTFRLVDTGLLVDIVV